MDEHGQFVVGKPSKNGPFSMAMLNNQMVKHLKTIGRSWQILAGSSFLC
jgi:hypothetical protein